MKEESKKEKITVRTVVDDVIGGTLTAGGVVGATLAMKQAAKYNVNPWLIPAIALGLGTAIKVGANFADNKLLKDCIKDLSSGFIAAGSLDLVVKTLLKFAPTLVAQLPAGTLPSLSGFSGLRGIGMGEVSARILNGPTIDTNATVVSSRMLN